MFGDARYRLDLVSVNAAYTLSPDAELYAFGTYGHKRAGGWANFRLPTRLPQIYPLGFSPVVRDPVTMIGASSDPSCASAGCTEPSAASAAPQASFVMISRSPCDPAALDSRRLRFGQLRRHAYARVRSFSAAVAQAGHKPLRSA